ncbi:hypothetical protein EBU95_21665, partial [bacterium]|nr:hypothetical protein [bacterium]
KFNLKSFEYWDSLVKLEAMSLHNLNIIDFQGYLGGLAFQGIDRGEGSQNFGAFKEKLKVIRETVMNAFAKKRNNQIISIENGGKFEFTEINNNHMDMGYTIIAQQKSALTGFPITWLLGRSPQGFNSTGIANFK